MPPLTEPQLLAAFRQFCATNWGFADIELITPATEAAESAREGLAQLAGSPEKAQAFDVLAQTGNASYIAFWQEPGPLVAPRPLVWLGSEGIPYGVFANSLADFFTLLPFGNGLISTTLWFCTGEHPRAHLLDEVKLAQELVPVCLAEMQQYYPGCAAYMVWLEQTAGLQVAGQPVAQVVQAYHAHTKVAEWLEE